MIKPFEQNYEASILELEESFDESTHTEPAHAGGYLKRTKKLNAPKRDRFRVPNSDGSTDKEVYHNTAKIRKSENTGLVATEYDKATTKGEAKLKAAYTKERNGHSSGTLDLK